MPKLSTQFRVTAPIADSVDESLRLAALQSYDILDTPREEAFDRVVRLVGNIFDVPIAFISMMTADRQWNKACLGVEETSIDRNVTFCRLVVQSGRAIVIPDLSCDDRLKNNPFVTGPAQLRFYAGIPLRTRDGFILGTLCAIDNKPRSFTACNLAVLTDLGAIVMHELELRRTAEVDGLTKVLTRGAFHGQARQVLALMARQERPSSVIMLDIDRFKAINDTYGHIAGDLVLSAVAGLCQKQIRSTDLLGRLGGEEFAILLPGSSSRDAARVAEKVRKAIAAAKFEVGDVVVSITSSFGIAAFEDDTDDLNALLGLADAGLYAAKSSGRNCVVDLQAEMKMVRPSQG